MLLVILNDVIEMLVIEEHEEYFLCLKDNTFYVVSSGFRRVVGLGKTKKIAIEGCNYL